jgi:tRNA (guanine26-N2/guanine27-N2)-dimethyltransferase
MLRHKEIVETREGMTRLLVPTLALSSKCPPKTPAFFNPSAKMSRDISILAYKAFVHDTNSKNRTFADAFCGLGARGLRVAVEIPEITEVYLNDINPYSIELAKQSAELNFVADKCNYSISEVCKFLITRSAGTQERFGLIDLDPFGSPARYVDCILRAIRDSGLISVTATDTAVLCGVYDKVCLRRYYGRPINNSYSNEIAVRLIASLLALTAARLEMTIYPLFAHNYLHYIRLYLKVKLSSSEANKVYENLGYLGHCFKCGNRHILSEYTNNVPCNVCGSYLRTGGQLWIKKLFDKDFIKKMIGSALQNNASEKSIQRIKNNLYTCLNENDDIPYYFIVDEIASKLKTSPQSVENIIRKLLAAGYRASTTSLSTRGVKTNAGISDIIRLLR